jgi:threonine dehydrogenase-like Zn-dependent dehydrogenase
MLALVYDGGAKLRGDVPRPKVARDEALVKVRVAGVCSTDLEVLKGYMNFRGVMGHEFVGEVLEGPAAWKSKRVVAEINCVCGSCDMCRRGLSTHCRDRGVLGIDRRDGVFAEYVSIPVRNLREVPESVSDDEAVFVEPLAAAFQILRQVKIDAADSVLVLGDGRLGQLVARVLRGVSGRLVMIGKHPAKLEAAEKQGVETRLAKEFSPAPEADVVVDATGSASGFELAMKAVRPRGTIVLKSTFAVDHGMNLAPLVINEITVVGSRCGPFEYALSALSGRRIDVAALISARYPLSRATEALEAARCGDRLKVLIDVE